MIIFNFSCLAPYAAIMKSRMFQIFPFVLSIITISFMSACSYDNEPDSDEMTGEEMASHIRCCVLNAKGEINFPRIESDGNPLYLCDFDSKDEAREYCADIICKPDWNGKNILVRLADGFGTVNVINSEQTGIYYDITLNVNSIPTATIRFVTPEYMSSDNLYKYPGWGKRAEVWECQNCKKIMKGDSPYKCSGCGSTDLKKSKNK